MRLATCRVVVKKVVYSIYFTVALFATFYTSNLNIINNNFIKFIAALFLIILVESLVYVIPSRNRIKIISVTRIDWILIVIQILASLSTIYYFDVGSYFMNETEIIMNRVSFYSDEHETHQSILERISRIYTSNFAIISLALLFSVKGINRLLRYFSITLIIASLLVLPVVSSSRGTLIAYILSILFVFLLSKQTDFRVSKKIQVLGVTLFLYPSYIFLLTITSARFDGNIVDNILSYIIQGPLNFINVVFLNTDTLYGAHAFNWIFVHCGFYFFHCTHYNAQAENTVVYQALK